MSTQQVFTAVCGQKDGVVEVSGPDVKNCPICGHPLSSVPQPQSAPPAPAPAAPKPDTIAGMPIVTTADQSLTPVDNTPRAFTREEKISNVGLALALMGYEREQADELANNAMQNLEDTQAAKS